MQLLQATLALYRDAGKDTLKALPRSGVALLFLVLAGAAELVLAQTFGGTGMAGGFVMGLVDAFLCGWYLALVHILVGQGRTLRMDDLREQLGVFFMEVITVGFVFGIPNLVLSLTMAELVFPYVVLVALAFNPIPEMIQQDRVDAWSLFGRALTFMKDNWPEWLAGHILLFGALGAVFHALTGAGWLLVPAVAMLYGPWMGFLGLGTLGMGLVASGPVGTVAAVALLVVGHGVMLFRAALYKRLARSSRRGRAWQARIG